MLRKAVQLLSAVATGAAVVEGASLVLRGARVAAKAATDQIRGFEIKPASATSQYQADQKKVSKQQRKETRKRAKEGRKRAQASESRLRKGAKLADGARSSSPAAAPASRQAARQAQMSRRMRQLSSALEKESDKALSRDQDLADALMEQSAAIAAIAENPPALASDVGDPIVAQLVAALSRQGGDDIGRMASDLASRKVPSPEDYGPEQEEETVFEVVMGWDDEDPDAIGSHCLCGSGGVCGCSLAGPDFDPAPRARVSPLATEPEPVQGGDWELVPDFARPFGLQASGFGSHPATGKRFSLGSGCKTGMCPMPQ